MALLARHLAYDFPQYYHYFSVPGFSYGGRNYVTHDNLLAAFDGTDGIKTGYTQLSGFNLVTSAVRDNKHVIGVVLGGPTAAVRDREMMRLLSAAFEVAKENPTILADANVPWQGGKGPESPLFLGNPLEDQSLMLAALEPNGGNGFDFTPADRLVMRSKDGFYHLGDIKFRLKMDAVPGTPTTLWFTPKYTTKEMKDITGNPDFVYEISCDQMCGNGHYSMKGVVEVVTQEEYDIWQAQQKPNYYAAFPDKDPANKKPATPVADSTKTTATAATAADKTKM